MAQKRALSNARNLTDNEDGTVQYRKIAKMNDRIIQIRVNEINNGNNTQCVEREYALMSSLGMGSFATVFEAKETGTDSIVAIKIPHDIKHNDLLIQEAEILRKLENDNIVKFFGDGIILGEPNPVHIIVMEHINGGELFKHISRRKNYKEGEARQIAHVLLQSLSYMHEQNIIHR
jgi:serine/threonine protein kinase